MSRNPEKSVHWNPERESALTHYVHKYGTKKWSVIVEKMK